VKLLQHNQPGSLLGAAGDAGGQLVPVLPDIVAVGLLD